MKVIFLDVDGVLNCTTSKSRCMNYVGIDADKIRRLKEIVDTTDAKIVLTTTWKDHYEVGAYKQIEKSAKYLNNKFRKYELKVYDKTSEKRWVDRALGIFNWLDEHPEVTHWLILDDDRFVNYDDPRIEPHWVKTFWTGHGLTDAGKDAAIKILNGELIGPYFDNADYETARHHFDGPLGWDH